MASPLMAQGVPIMYGECVDGPWHKKHLAHHETPREVPIDRFSKKVAVAMQRTPATEKTHWFGYYHFREGKWHWKPPEED